MHKQCRSCLNIAAPTYLDMDSMLTDDCTYMQGFLQCTQLYPPENANYELTKLICLACSNSLHIAFEFIRNARHADKVLRQNFTAKPEYQGIQEQPLEFVEQIIEDDSTEIQEECTVESILEETEPSETYTIMQIVEPDEEHLMEEYETIVEDIDIKPDLIKYSENPHELEVAREESQSTNTQIFYEDENDEDYMIEYEDNLEENKNISKWKCLECKRILRGDVTYEGHMNVHKNVQPYKCASCPVAFRCKKTLEQHFKLRHTSTVNKELFYCSICGNMFQSNDLLKEHEVKEHPLKPCEDCDKCFYSREAANEHVYLIHSTYPTIIDCPYCQQKTPIERIKIKEHIQTHHPEEYGMHFSDHLTPAFNKNLHIIYKCQFCYKSFESAKAVGIHITTTHPEQSKDDLLSKNMVQCDICKKRLLCRNFEKHLELHKRKELEALKTEGRFLCAYCPRECKNQKSLVQHEKIHEHNPVDEVFLCTECDRPYASENLLMQHRKQAHKERDHVCSICGNAFKLKNQLVNHMKLHMEKNIPCPLCDKKYSRTFDLTVHMRTHTGELPYACHLCDRRFAIKVRLTYHLQKHYGVKHPCKECGLEFNSKQKLKAHSFKHTGMPYRCQACGDHGFANRDVFKRHLHRVHNTSMTEEALAEMFQQNTGKTTRIRPITELGQNISMELSENEEFEVV